MTAPSRPPCARLRRRSVSIARTSRCSGTLPPYRTVSSFLVTPVVALIGATARLQADPEEVDEAFEVPLAFLMDSAHHQRRLVTNEARPRALYALEYRGERRYLIWGATAAMLRNFYRFLGA